MGIITSRDTRRISFDNTFALSNSALAVPKSIENENIISFNELAPDTTDEIEFSEKTSANKIYSAEVPEERDIDYWAQRIENLKKEHQIINSILESEYEKEIEKIYQNYEPPVVTHEKILKVKPCFDWRTKLMQCYQENPHQTLVCSSVVQAFSNCVASCRSEE